MIFSLVTDYLYWHYSIALVQYIRLVRNWWWYVSEYFSISLLTRTLFAPLPLITTPGVFTSIMSRLGGMVLRLGTIIAGLSLMTIGVMVSLLGYIVWLVAPLLPLLFLVIGSVLFITSLINL